MTCLSRSVPTTGLEHEKTAKIHRLTIRRPIALVVEDNGDLRNYIKNQLLAEYQVIEAENGVKGLSRARAMIPDIVVSDWMMPEMDGIMDV